VPSDELEVDFSSQEAMDDPYSLYEEIRATGNVVWNPGADAWMVVGFEEAMSILTDNGDRFAELNSDPEFVFWFDALNMIMVDGAEHRRLRGALAPLFTRSAVAKWERRVAEVVDDLLAPLVAGARRFDLIADFTTLPTVIVAEMLGVPGSRHEDFQRWSHGIVANRSRAREPDRRAVMQQVAVEINGYFSEEIERHRQAQTDDLLTTMLNLSGTAAMTDEEIRSAAVMLLIAGYDTTAKAMSNCLIALEQNPVQRRRVVNDLSRVPAAIEESLRWLGPVQWIPRVATANTVIDGAEIGSGHHVLVMLAAANRDPRRWADPARFDVDRAPKAHVGFGYGPHLCLGAPLARLEMKVAIERLLRLAPEYHLLDLDFGQFVSVRGPEGGLIEV
jgi:cytochrome P450